jgi:two-component system NtrC family sensor kinase
MLVVAVTLALLLPPGRLRPLVGHGASLTLAFAATVWVGWPGVFAGLATVIGLAAEVADREQELDRLYRERDELAHTVDRRINEIFSLQELSYVLAESLHSERIAERVTHFVTRFLNSEGAALALTAEDGRSLRVAAAEGTLAGFAGSGITDDPPSLVARSVATERIEVGKGTDSEPVFLLPGHRVESGAAAPLRAHGLTMGVLAVANRRAGSFSAEDLWLLSTVSTQVAVVLANSRLFEMVRQAKEEWETAFNALTEGIAVLDRGGRIARGNRALSRLLDMPAPALLGRAFWSEVVGPAEGEEWLIGAAGRGERPAPLTLRSPALGRVLRLTAAPLAEPSDHAAVVVLVADVTEQRALEAQLIQSEKLAAVGQLVSGVAHELNNPLTSIAGLSEFLQERPGLQQEREHLRVIHEQAERAGRIVQNLLTFARRGTASDALVDLNDVVERTARVVAYELELRGIALVQHLAGSPLPVRGSRDELQQVVVNLVTNAIHAVRDLPEGTPREVTLTTAEQAGTGVVRVQDTGPGVDPALVHEIFSPFFTTKPPGEGTGLGLSLSYRIVESHGGRLAYIPRPAGGAEFWFGLPLAASGMPTPSPVATTETDARAVLLVDGDPGMELVVRALLEPAGYTVTVARTAATGAEYLERNGWSVIVLDGSLSADGKRLLVEDLPAGDDVRVVVATSDPVLATRCRHRGLAVAPRPFLPRDLLAAVGDRLEGRAS